MEGGEGPGHDLAVLCASVDGVVLGADGEGEDGAAVLEAVDEAWQALGRRGRFGRRGHGRRQVGLGRDGGHRHGQLGTGKGEQRARGRISRRIEKRTRSAGGSEKGQEWRDRGGPRSRRGRVRGIEAVRKHWRMDRWQAFTHERRSVRARVYAKAPKSEKSKRMQSKEEKKGK